MKTATVLLLVGLVAKAQTETKIPTFEVASVKIANQGGGWGIDVKPNGITMKNATLRILMHYAWGLTGLPEEERQIAGGQRWIDEDTYDVDGKTIEPMSEKGVMSMLRTLLVERFQMRFHMETKDLWTFSLVVAKGGPKLQEVDPKDGRHQLGHGLTVAEFGMMFVGSPATGYSRAVDKTGLAGTYDFTSVSGFPLRINIESRPEQTGLELRRDKTALPIVVIDHAERVPLAN